MLINQSQNRLEVFRQLVERKFNVYDALFLNLPFEGIEHTGIFLPLLSRACVEGLSNGKEPLEIINQFFSQNTTMEDEEVQIEFLFRAIQYVERQVVLFDSVEDAAFAPIAALGRSRSIQELIKAQSEEAKIEQLFNKLEDFGIRLVFTAHPTQFYPQEVLGIIERLRKHVLLNDLEGIDQTLQQLGLTSFLQKNKPTPYEEAQNIIYFLRYVFYDAIGNFFTQLKSRVSGWHEFENADLIRIGFWPGGDRDGNPFVKSQTTLQVADELRLNLMKCYYKDIKDLQEKLTFRSVREDLQELRERIYPCMFDPSRYVPHDHILDILEEVRDKVVHDYNKLYLKELDQLIDKVRIFKSHFATLDIRQDHRIHRSVVNAVLKRHGEPEVDETNIDVLLELLERDDIKADPDQHEDPLVHDTLENISRLSVIQRRNGEAGCNRYIISNSEDVYAVLYVYVLFKWCGWEMDRLTFDIVPLFETMIGMQQAEETMRQLFKMPFYRNHVANRNDRQTIMLGFSDGTKDGGYLQANWSIFKTKETLTTVCREFGVEVVFFDGRGGPPARGGGKTHRFYASLGKGIANHEIQLTIQGQTITSTYGTKDQFTYNCEQMLTAGIVNDLMTEEQASISEYDRKLIDELAELSYSYYTALKEHPLFIPYLEEMSTLQYYGKANIGSRPGKRGRTDKLTLDDLRAISFVGAWSQLKQNVPGYYGLGYAFEKLIADGRGEELKSLFQNVPFFKAVVLNSMMSMKKSNFALTAYMSKHPRFKEFWEMLHAEFVRSRNLSLEIADYDELMQEEPISKTSIEIREEIVLPLLTIQQYALQRIAGGDPKSKIFEKMVVRSLYGNINASRNSA